MRGGGLLLAACAVLQPILLGGCVAAVVPVVAGGIMAKSRMDGKPDGGAKGEHRREAREAAAAAHTASPAQDARSAREKRRDERRARKREREAAKLASLETAAAPPADGEPAPERLRPLSEADMQQLKNAGLGTPQVLTGLTALPAPGSVPGAVGAGFPAFTRYALAAAQPKPGQPFRSALIDPSSLTTRPVRSECGKQPPAVAVDLDPGKEPFDLDDPPAPAPGLAEQLATLRAAGVTVLWQASLPAAASERLYASLAATGLDPDRTDRLLLIRKEGERKQARRQAAARDWCILAVAGDSKADFEEAFDYLRDPDGIIAQALTANLEDGWFVTPQPID